MSWDSKKLSVEEKEWVLEQLCSGLTMREVKQHGGAPDKKKINFTLFWDQDFQDKVDKALEFGAQDLFDQAKEVAFDESRDIMEDENGKPIFNKVSVARDKLKVDVLLKHASVRNKKLSEKNKVEIEDVTDYATIAAAAAARANAAKLQKQEDDIADE